jgi:hypothetical protein
MRLYTAITDDGFVSDETKAKIAGEITRIPAAFLVSASEEIAGTVSTSGRCHLGDSSDTILPDVRS